MPRKTITIFITVFILVGAVMLGFYYYKNSNSNITGDTTNSGYQSFNPFSNGSDSASSENNQNTDGENILNNTSNIPNTGISSGSQFSKFHKITDFPVAGAVFFEDNRPIVDTVKIEPTDISTTITAPLTDTKTKAKITAKPTPPKFEIVPSLRYVEKVTGHIYQMYLDTKIAGKISNSTIPSIYEAIFDGKAKTVIYRYLASDGITIDSFIATLGGTKGEFLPENIVDVSTSIDKSKFFYLTKNKSGVVGSIKNFGDGKTTQVFSSPFSEWLSQWVGNQKIYLTTKASAQVSGSLYSLNTATGSISKVFGGIPGLTTLANNDGSIVLYNSSAVGDPKLGLFDVNKHSTSSLDIYSLPEKCVWGSNNINVYCSVPINIPNGQYPDFWYQGLVSFNDRFVKIDTTTGDITTIADSTSETPVDGTHLFLNKSEDQLFFINKKDSMLWSLDLR